MINRLVWMDLEMTGLNPEQDVVLEIAALVTDSDLEPIDSGIDLVIHQPEEALASMVPVVVEMHARSGLTDAVRAATLTLAEAEQQVLRWLKILVPEPNRAPLCGNSIATDRSFLVRHMPELDAWMHYRMVDVSSVKELARRWYPPSYGSAPAKAGGHRALVDVRESIAELRHYRSTIFVPTHDVASTPPAAPTAPPEPG